MSGSFESTPRVLRAPVEIAASYARYYGGTLRGRAHLTCVLVTWKRHPQLLRRIQLGILGVCAYIERPDGEHRYWFSWDRIMAAAAGGAG